MPKSEKQRKLDRLVEKLRNDDFDYVPREKKDINWSKYDDAQINEMNDMLLLIRDTVDESARRLDLDIEKPEGRGRPPLPAADLAKAVLIQQYFDVANRTTAGLVLLFEEKMGFERPFSYKSVERAYEDPRVVAILNEVFDMTQEPVSDKESSFAPDGTGLPISMKKNWESEGDGDDHEGYDYMVGMAGTTYGIYSAVEFPKNPNAHESPFFEPLLQRTAAHYSSIDLVSGDSAFLARDNCDLVIEAGGIPRFYPKKGITLKRKGSWAWTEMLLDFIENPQQWLREYHTRSNVESGFSTFKRHFLSPLRKCIGRRRKTETFARACDYNLKRASYIRRQEGLTAPWMAA